MIKSRCYQSYFEFFGSQHCFLGSKLCFHNVSLGKGGNINRQHNVFSKMFPGICSTLLSAALVVYCIGAIMGTWCVRLWL